MAFNRSVSSHSRSFLSFSKKKRRKSDSNSTQYSVLEPRNLLAGLVITEFVASNGESYVDDNGNTTDWIELYNDGPAINDLSVYSLTDDPSDPTKFVLPSISLGASQHLVVVAGDDALPNTGSDIYTGFGLSASGEYLGLYGAFGNVLSEFGVGGADYPTQITDVSYGVAFGGNFDQVSYFATPTPGAPNTNPIAGVVDRVSASLTPGFFDSTQSVSLSTPTSGATIRYTLDGSTPTSSSAAYTGPISITGTTTLRAVGTRSGYLSVPDRTFSYIFVDDVINQSNNGVAPANFPEVGSLVQELDYGIDPDVIGIEGAQAIKDALLAIPSWSITTDIDNLFDPATGIYANPQQDGRDWERAASVEQLNPDGSEGFQVNAGLRIRGASSRSPDNPKHSFKLFFRSEYGDSSLDYNLFTDNPDAATSFEKIDLRTAQNRSWSKEGDDASTFVVDEFNRQNQQALGQPSTNSSWVHLYLNGQYWGLYQTQERVDADFGVSYFGGDAEDYDVIKADADGYVNVAADGNLNAYIALHNQALARAADGETPAFVNDAAYMRAQGLNPDGSDNPAFDTLLDVDNLIAYMIVTLQSGNIDGPLGPGGRVNNYFTLRDRTGDEGFKFFIHDTEHTYTDRRNTAPVDRNVNGAATSDRYEEVGARYFNPQWLHQQLMANEEYRIAFADKVQESFFNGGENSAANQVARIDAQIAAIDQAIIAESARWGDAQRSAPFLRSDWVNATGELRDVITPREAVVVEQFKNTTLLLLDGDDSLSAPLVPNVDAPNYLIDGTAQHGGEVTTGAALTLSGPDAIFYTTDGSDPRSVGGSVSSTATSYDPAVVTTNLVEFGDTWNFLDTGVDQGTAWRSSSFDDSTWDSDVGQFGYGNNGERTTVNFGGVDNDKHITTYFRKTFNVSAGNYLSATLSLIRDDGVVVYLDGVEIGRNNFDYLPANAPIDFDTRAGNAIGGGAENTSIPFPININALQPGSHTLAIEVHQVNATSSDLSFDAELEITQQTTGSGAIVLNDSTNVRSRTLSNGEWSALNDAFFVIPGSQSDLRITELNYNPAAPTDDEVTAGYDNDDFEFVELYNPSANTINLSGVQFTDGIVFTFGDADQGPVELGPGERGVIVRNADAFEDRYGTDVNVLGPYAGGLNNGGETLELVDSLGVEITSVTYNDGGLWSVAADGEGASLVLDSDTTSNSLLGKYYSWRASVEYGGTPGTASVSSSGVVVNEIVANTDSSDLDSIELFNSTGSSINIGGWYLSDSGSDTFQYQIPNSTVLSAGGYLVFDENDFNFALSSLGEEVFLTRSVNGLPAFEDAVEFGATFNGDSVGRLPNGSGRLAHIDSPTLGQANQTHGVADLIISEVHYNPLPPTGNPVGVGDNDIEFVEVFNRSNQALDLSDWRLRGDVDFDFPQVTLQPGQSIPVLAFDPSVSSAQLDAFRAQYGISTNVPLLGGFSGDLGNSFGRVSLQQADSPPASDPTITPWVTVDEVVYDDLAPFADADNNGLSLNRISSTSLGNDASSWSALAPTPGSTSIIAGGVEGRYVFYNNSSFDGNNSSANASDDLAISGKSALLPGLPATYANYTNYSKGINGLFIDIADLGSTQLTASDFGFATGNSNVASGFQSLGIDPVITVRSGAGVNGSDRVSLIFPDGSVTQTWLQVTVRANAATGLDVDDVFYFGNVIGETGNSGNAVVNLVGCIADSHEPVWLWQCWHR